MTPHDNHLHNHQADRDAAYDMALDAMREQTHVTGYELFEQLPFLTDAQLLQFCDVVAATDEPVIRNMVRLVCGDIIERKAKQAMAVRK